MKKGKKEGTNDVEATRKVMIVREVTRDIGLRQGLVA
jgi:hypothetical protein